MSEFQIFLCGPPKDHKCDTNGPNIVFNDDGEIMLESEAMKLPDWPKGWRGSSVTCSGCGLDAMSLSMWQS